MLTRTRFVNLVISIAWAEDRNCLLLFPVDCLLSFCLSKLFYLVMHMMLWSCYRLWLSFLRGIFFSCVLHWNSGEVSNYTTTSAAKGVILLLKSLPCKTGGRKLSGKEKASLWVHRCSGIPRPLIASLPFPFLSIAIGATMIYILTRLTWPVASN